MNLTSIEKGLFCRHSPHVEDCNDNESESEFNFDESESDWHYLERKRLVMSAFPAQIFPFLSEAFLSTEAESLFVLLATSKIKLCFDAV